MKPLQGAWGGRGAKQKPKPKPHLLKAIPGVDPTSRADFGKAHVIISEKKDKKAQKYLVKDLPFPYTGRAQFERSLETPLGAEWNTRVGFQRGTLPKVTKKVRSSVSIVIRTLNKTWTDGHSHCTCTQEFVTRLLVSRRIIQGLSSYRLI